MKNLYREFTGNRMKALRLEKKKKQMEMASLLGIKLKAYQSYEEKRAEPSIFIIKKFCKIIRMKVDKFLEGSPESDLQKA